MMAGTAADSNIILQIGSHLPQILPKAALTVNAHSWPRTMKIAFLSILALRDSSGEISAKYIGDRVEAAPTAIPKMKRKIDIDDALSASVQRIVVTVKISAINLKVFLRPILSANLPQPNAPKHAPTTNELETIPCNAGDKSSWLGLLMNASAPLIIPVS